MLFYLRVFSLGLKDQVWPNLP